MLWSLAVLALLASVQGRAVNISNTWVLPEEGFPVFYRYFRDRISWYEADAVCQFHHANLVTVDTTAQYDALRAYLKELDISSAVWVGLIRSNPDGDFTWTDYRGLSGEGYWSSAPDTSSAPLCAAADPTADYRWEARACGGPMVASFICELPVPQWASGSEGCMVRELPALTVLYLPESAAVQLTADCGLAGVKRVQCTGSVKRDELLANLSCAKLPEDLTTSLTSEATITTASSEEPQEVNNDETITTEREVITQQEKVHLTPIPEPEIKNHGILSRISLSKDINLNMIHDNNLESNDIPKVANQNENELSEEEANRLEDEKHMQHKILHNEYARLGNIGNFENIFSQPADHFVPPLVMAKARISDDMTVLSLEEKHAQQLAEQQHAHRRKYEDINSRLEPEMETFTTEKIITTEKPLIITTPAFKTKDTKKYSSSKKYNEKYADPKSRNMKNLEKSIKLIEKATTQVPTTTVKIDILTTSGTTTEKKLNETEEDPSIDLSVIIQEPAIIKNIATTSNLPVEGADSATAHSFKEVNVKEVITKTTSDSVTKNQTEPLHEMTHEVIKITILDEVNPSATPTVFEITTKVPVIEISRQTNNMVITTSKTNPNSEEITTTTTSQDVKTEAITQKTMEISTSSESEVGSTTVKQDYVSTSKQIPEVNINRKETTISPNTPLSTADDIDSTTAIISNPTANNTTSSNATTVNGDSISSTTQKPAESTKNHANITEESIDDKLEEIHDGYDTSTQLGETIDDLNSPLLSAANEPLHRPNRSRRPQQPSNRNKFNPFRMLG